jgi:hypothetical protein
MSRKTHYWVVVAAGDHASSGIKQGIVQANHGKEAPLRRMHPGDSLLIYAPKLIVGGNAPLQQFIAIGTVADEPVYQVAASDDFHPFRRRVMYEESVTGTPVQPLIEQLDFIQNKVSWGYAFRLGCFAISEADFNLIRSSMTNQDHA